MLYSIVATLALISLCYILFIFVWYVDEKFSLILGDGRYLFWFLIVLSILCLWMFMPVLLVLVILACILVILLPSKGKRESYPWKRKKPGLTWVLLGVGALVIFLLVFFISSNGFGMLSTPENTRDPGQFEIRIVNSSGVSSKIMGTEGIQSVSDPQQYFSDGSWSITFTFNDEGAIAFRQAIIDSGATENPDEHPVSIVLDNKTIAAQPLSQEFANELKQRAGKIVMVSTGSGIDGQVQAGNIVNTIRASRGNSWKLF
ncbi:MAG: hypothetical protein ABSE07_07020 [Methanoregula sp.]